MADLIDRYLEFYLPSKPKNAKDTVRHLNWWKSKLGKHTLNHISADVISAHRKELSEGTTIQGKQRTGATTNRYIAALSSVLTFGVKECGWLSSNPTLKVSKLKEPRGRDRVLTKEECERLLLSCTQSKNLFLYTVVIIAISTGARRGEILGLNWNDIDLEKGIIFLKDTKSGYPRSLPLVGPSLKELQKLFKVKNPFIPFVFPSKKRFGEVSIRKAWEEALKRADIKDLRFHDLRHTFATFAAIMGASNLQLATVMGHRSLSMLSRYTHLNVEHTKELSDSVTAQLLCPKEINNGSY